MQQGSKPPLFPWAVSGFLLFIKNPILAGRLVSVTTGFLTFIGLWFLSYEIFKNKRTAYVTALIYIFYPFSVVYDRMALVDSMVGMFAVWSIYVTVLMVRRLRLDLAYTLGFLLGGGSLTKSNAFFIEYLLPLSILFIKLPWKLGKILRWALLMMAAALVSQILYLITSLTPDYQIVLGGNSIFIYSFHAFFKLTIPFIIGNFLRNFMLLGGWIFEYLTFLYVLLLGFSVFFIKRNSKEKIYLFLYFLIPFVVVSLFGKHLYPRYIYFITLPLLLLIGDSLVNLFNFKRLYSPWLTYGMYFLAIIYPLYISATFIFAPANAMIPKIDVDAYTNKFFTPFVDYFKNQADKNKIIIVTNGHQREQEALILSLANNPNIVIKEYDKPVGVLVPMVSSRFDDNLPTYLVTFKDLKTELPEKNRLEIILSEKADGGREYMVLKLAGKGNK